MAGDMNAAPEEKIMEFYRGIYDKSVKLEKIINDILRASEFDTKKFALTPVSAVMAPEEVIETAVHEAHEEAEQRKIDLLWTKPATPLPNIRAEKMFLVEALGNLISNALKYTPSLVNFAARS